MSALTEQEIFDCMAENLRLAAEDCRKLAWHPRRGFVYDHFRQCLQLVEGACRQAYYWRDFDSRWLDIGKTMHWAHERAGDWIRSLPSKEGRKVAHPRFQKLSELLTSWHQEAQGVRTMATFRSGPIMPETLPGPHRDTKPVQVMRPSGLIVPAPNTRRSLLIPGRA